MTNCPRGVYDHTGLRSERIKILRVFLWELRGTLEGIKYRETRHICISNDTIIDSFACLSNRLKQKFA